MAITFQQAPQRYSPANNPLNFYITTDIVDVAYFLINVRNSANVVISTLKLRPTPMNKQGVFFSLTNILTAQTTLLKSDNIVEYLSTDLFAYTVQAEVFVRNFDGSTSTSGQALTYTGNTVWNGELPIDAFSSFNYTTWVANASGTGRFLTSRPAQSTISPLNLEYLYFLNEATATKVRFTFYYNNGNSTNRDVALSVNQKLARLNISPLVLEATGSNITDLNYYSVSLLNATNTIVIQPVYRYIKKFCSNDNIQIVWQNNLGGYDSYLFKNIRESRNNTKITSTTNPYRLNITEGVYKNNANNIFNQTEVTLDSQTTSTFTVVSEVLSNEEASWLPTVLESKKVYVLLDNTKLFPITVKDNSASIQNSRYNSQPNQFELSFTAPSGISIQKFTGEQFFPYVLPINFI